MSKVGVTTSFVLPMTTTGFADPQIPFEAFALDKFVSTINPAMGHKNWDEGMDRLVFDYNTWAADPSTKVVIEMAPRDYAEEQIMQDDFIKEFFDIEETDAEIHITNKIIFGRDIAAMHARGTLIPYITSTTEKSITRNTYRHQAFDLDWFTLDKIEGKADREYKMKELVWNVQRSHLNTVVNTFFVTPQGARTAEQQNGEYTLPKTIPELCLIEQNKHGIFNKSTTALFDLVRDANNVFSQFDLDLATTHVFMSFSDTFYMQKYNDIAVRADSSGNAAASNKKSLELRRDFGSFTVVNVPFIEVNIQDGLNHTFTRPFSTGSNINFLNKSVNVIKGYKSWMRDQQYADQLSGGMSYYRYIDHLHALPHFIPKARNGERDEFGDNTYMEEGHTTRKRKDVFESYERTLDTETGEYIDGRLDYKLLIDFAKDSSILGKDMMTRMGVRMRGNEHALSEAMRAVDKTYGSYLGGSPAEYTDCWYPLVFMSQLHESRCKEQYYAKSHESMANALYSNLSNEEVDAWKMYLQLALDDPLEFTRRYTSQADIETGTSPAFLSAVNKIIMRLECVTDDSPLLSDYIDASRTVLPPVGSAPGTPNTYVSYERVSVPTRPNPYSGCMKHFMNAVWFISAHHDFYSMYPQEELDKRGLTHIKASNTFDDKMKAANEIRRNKITTGPWWFRKMKEYPVFTPEIGSKQNGKISTFVHRFLSSFAYDADLLFAAQANIWSNYTLHTMDKRTDNDIHITLGGMNMRNREMQNMHSILCVALLKSGPRAKLGKFYKGPTDSVCDFEPTRRKHSYTFGFSHGAGILNPEQMYWQRRVRGGNYIGGSDSFYANQRMLLTTRDYTIFQRHQLQHGSNVAIAASYNQSIEGARLACFDQRGYFHVEDFVGRLEPGDWSSVTQDRPPVDGLALFNYMHRLNSVERGEFKGIDMEKLNFNQESLLREYNNVSLQLNSLTYNPETGNFDESTSYHQWGRLGANTGMYVTSESNVTQAEEDIESLQKKKKVKYDTYN